MTQISAGDVKTALEQVERAAESAGSGPLVTPEQLERILSVNQQTDPVAKAAKTAEVAQALIGEAEAARGLHEDLLSQLGLEADQAGRFLDGDRLGPGSREDLRDALERFEAQVVGEAEAEAERLLGGSGLAGGDAPLPQAGQLRV